MIKKQQIFKDKKNSLNITNKTLQKINNKIINNEFINIIFKTMKFNFGHFYKHIIY